MLSSYNCYRIPKKENLKEILLEVAHQKLIQKPRYVTNCFSSVFTRSTERLKGPFNSVEQLLHYYEQRLPSSRYFADNLIKELRVREIVL